ncbi:sensor histidine kinase [Marinactinospora rubrisoli]|uniref:histidine kinase n=1 Tax=Marinactinospora rubrisoli TaxID=2715399 RepID=A0ABW2KBB5_9ACTN
MPDETAQHGRLLSGAWPVRIGRWAWARRHRFADWGLAVLTFPVVAVFQAGLPQGPLDTVADAVRAAGWVPGMLITATVCLGGALAVSAAILFRRSRPEILLAVAAVLLYGFGNIFAAPVALYSHASWFTDRRVLAAWTAVLSLGVCVAYADAVVPAASIVLMLTVMVVLPLTAGLWVGTRRQLIDNLHERAVRLERERHLLAEQAITSERTRIAREMHDVVAHRVSLMVLHAGGLEVSSGDPRTAETAGLIRTTGREALAELREILGVLRESDAAEAPTTPQPVLADVARLIAEWRAAGTPVEWRTTGTPRALPPQVERTAYRTVQEALTNAGKHAPGCPVTVRLGYGDSDLEIVVANEPPRAAAPTADPPPSGGYGLAGLRERIALVGGTFSAGPFPDGGWQVRAIVPVGGMTDEDEGAAR